MRYTDPYLFRYYLNNTLGDNCFVSKPQKHNGIRKKKSFEEVLFKQLNFARMVFV